MFKYLKLRDYIPLVLAIMAGALLLSTAKADPAILNGNSGDDCQYPVKIDPYQNKVRLFLDSSKSDENDVNITSTGTIATADCESVDLKVRARALNQFDLSTLPLEIKLRGKDYRRVYCRIEDSDGTQYFTRDWLSLVRIELQGAKFKVTKKLSCVDGKYK